jgi:cytochrome c5
MTRHLFSVIMGIVTTTLLPLYAVPQAQPNTPRAVPPHRSKVAPKKGETHPEDGESIFQQQCSRCHTTPEGFSPRISGTILRHMRVRASLSQSDEQKLLRFLNP